MKLEVSLVMDNAQERALFPCARPGCECAGATCSSFFSTVVGTGVRAFVPCKIDRTPAVALAHLKLFTATGTVQSQWTPDVSAHWRRDIGAYEFILRSLPRSRPGLYFFGMFCADGSVLYSAPFHLMTALPNWLFIDGAAARKDIMAEFARLHARWTCMFETSTCVLLRVDNPMQAARLRFLPDVLQGMTRELVVLTVPAHRSKAVIGRLEAAVRDCAVRRQSLEVPLDYLLQHASAPRTAISFVQPLHSNKRPRGDDDVLVSTDWPAAVADDVTSDAAFVAALTAPAVLPPPSHVFPKLVHIVGTSKFVVPKADLDAMLRCLELPSDFSKLFDEPDLFCYETL